MDPTYKAFIERDTAGEYENAAEYKAKRGKLPPLLSTDVADQIFGEPEAFEERVRVYQYANARNARLDSNGEGE